ncbi:RsiV family protein [Mucilaginibacter sp. AW1-7]|uniref:RsiV family protein n=1 Tax=unclassified Mucilaginibacter TaxID=2617802 RepID=UPI0023671288|nr:RsiV family protein [Mucilaginibacter sp. KACC 22773]WDF79973.1 RsiV family protein [Mucilaginibacter sp. KACC 22773]
MKTVSRLCFILAGFAFASCQWSVKPKEDKVVFKDTLRYSTDGLTTFPATLPGQPVNHKDTVVKARYVVFEGQPRLNDSVMQKLSGIFTNGNADIKYLHNASKFLLAYADYLKKHPKWTVSAYAKVLMQDSSITTLEVGGYTYQGGAHGSSGTYFINWNTKANKSITLNDLFIDGYADKLKAIAEGIFRKEEKLSDTASLARDYFFKDNRFALNDNFSVTPIGLKFIYNQYEIKPYAAGITELFIPYSQIKTLLRPNSVVGKFIK